MHLLANDNYNGNKQGAQLLPLAKKKELRIAWPSFTEIQTHTHTYTHKHVQMQTSQIDLHTYRANKHCETGEALIFGISPQPPHLASPHCTKSRMINCQNMLGKAKSEAKRAEKRRHPNNIIKSVCLCANVCANEFLSLLYCFCNFLLLPFAHTPTHTHAYTCICIKLSLRDYRHKIYYHLRACVRVWVHECMSVCLPLTLAHSLCHFAIGNIHTLLCFIADTHSNLLSKLNLRLADQFNNMNHMERFALERCEKNFQFLLSLLIDFFLLSFWLSSVFIVFLLAAY